MCKILTQDPEGGANRVSFEVFQTLYKYLASLSGEISQAQIDSAIAHLQDDV